MRTLGGYDAEYADDDGTADARVREALAAAQGVDPQAYVDAVVELCLSRLLIPVMAGGDETMEPDPQRAAEVSAVLLQRPDGAKALPAFTGTDSLAEWQPQARPVPATLDAVAQAAVAEGASTILVDLAGPAPLVLEHDFVGPLAQGQRLARFEDGSVGWIAGFASDGPMA